MKQDQGGPPDPSPLDLDATKASGLAADAVSCQLIAEHRRRTQQDFADSLARLTNGSEG